LLVEFQQALADLVSAPQLCREVRAEPSRLRGRYDLSDKEFERLIAMVNHPGMQCNCMLYRANRLAPLALNLPRSCRLLGSNLGALLSEYSTRYPNTNVHFYRECHRFCSFVEEKLEQGLELRPEVREALEQEFSAVKLALSATSVAL